MERNGDVEEKRKRAHAFLRDLLSESTSKSPDEISHCITDLAFESSNPVRDLFLTAVPNDATSAPRSPKLKGSKILRLARRENKNVSPAVKPPLSSQPTIAQDDHVTSSSSNGHSEGNQGLTQPSVQAVGKPSDGLIAVPYKCILCDEDMSSKGVCKRHLDEQHVSPKLFRCEKCNKDHSTKAEAKKHVNSCGAGIFTWVTVKTPHRKIYASEFKEECFSSKGAYLEHLLKQSKSGAARPQPSLHCKLRALLSHQSLRFRVEDLSKELYGYPTAWRSIQWTDEQLQSAIKDLEEAVIVHENGAIGFGGIGSQTELNIQHFLEELLCNGTLPAMPHDTADGSLRQRDPRLDPDPGTSQLNNLVIASPAFVPTSPMEHLPDSNTPSGRTSGDSGEAVTYVARELKVKRQLSDESRFKEQGREPPGPLSAPIHFQSPFNASENAIEDTRMPDMTPTMLPYRTNQEEAMVVHQSEESNVPQTHPYSIHALSQTSYSAATSEITLVPGQQEPGVQDPSQRIFWTPTQSTAFLSNLDISGKGSLPYLYHHQYPSEVSLRTPSIATDHTYVSTSQEQHKLQDFASDPSYPGAAFGNILHQFYGMNGQG